MSANFPKVFEKIADNSSAQKTVHSTASSAPNSRQTQNNTSEPVKQNTSEKKNNKNLLTAALIGLGAIAAAGIGFAVLRKKPPQVSDAPPIISTFNRDGMDANDALELLPAEITELYERTIPLIEKLPDEFEEITRRGQELYCEVIDIFEKIQSGLGVKNAYMSVTDSEEGIRALIELQDETSNLVKRYSLINNEGVITNIVEMKSGSFSVTNPEVSTQGIIAKNTTANLFVYNPYKAGVLDAYKKNSRAELTGKWDEDIRRFIGNCEKEYIISPECKTCDIYDLESGSPEEQIKSSISIINNGPLCNEYINKSQIRGFRLGPDGKTIQSITLNNKEQVIEEIITQ